MKFTKIIAPLVALPALVSPAFAQAVDPQDFADTITKLFARAEFQLTFDSVSMTGNDITLSGVNAAPKGERLVDFDVDMVFTNVQPSDDGGYTADTGSIDELFFEEDDISLSVSDMIWEGVYLNAEIPDDPVALAQLPTRYAMGPLSVVVEGNEVLRIASMEGYSQPTDDGTVVNGGYAVEGIVADLSLVEEEDRNAAEMLQRFGLTTLEMRMSFDSYWAVEEGKIGLSDFTLDVTNIGQLGFMIDVLGYDEDLIRRMYDMQEAAANGVMDEEFALAQMMAMANDLFLDRFSLRFDDDGVTDKLLDLAAEEEDMPRGAMTIGFAAMLPVMAAEFGVSDELQNALLQATTAYVTDPQSFEIRFEPVKPIRFSRIAEAVEDEDAPALLEMLNPSVTANQPAAE